MPPEPGAAAARLALEQDERPAAGRRELLYALLALASILIGISRLGDPRPAAAWVRGLDVAISAAFLLDWTRRVVEARERGRYALRTSYEILTFIPFTLIPQATGGAMLRAARLVRILRFARYGRYAKLGLALTRLPRRIRYVQRVMRHAQLVTLLVVGVLIVSLGGALLLMAEGAHAGLQGYEQALWWSLAMFTTVAYAVPEPATPVGYAITGSLVVAGVAYIGVFTASLANALLRTPPDEDRP